MVERSHIPADEQCSAALWEAYRYLSDELTAEEAAAYELLLGDDLAAAEALAQAVMLQESLDRARVATPLSRPAVFTPRPDRRVLAAALVVAAALLLAIGWYVGGRGSMTQNELTQGGSNPSPAVADAADTSVLSVWVSLNDARDLNGDDAAVESPAEMLADADVPDWMFAALLAPAESGNGMPDALPPVMDPIMEGSL
jgi:hypothetical protein